MASKPRYELLDGLRGVAALMVLIYHIGEAFATSPYDQACNHGYLAVHFFFILSGFVIGYAYEGRWSVMTTWEFFKRRIIRLHPMVVIGVLLGAASFLIQGSVRWDGSHVALSAVMWATLCTLFLIPARPGSSIEIRGNGELFPLNGPLWSLFIEYIGNILYALILRRLSTRALTAVVILLGVGLFGYALGNGSGYGHLGVGWAMADGYLWAGILCMAFCFSMGLLLARNFRPIPIRGAFWICASAIALLVALPYLGNSHPSRLNALYDVVCVCLIFPCILWVGASGVTTDTFSSRTCRLFGELSYPVYVIHYPSMYLFYA